MILYSCASFCLLFAFATALHDNEKRFDLSENNWDETFGRFGRLLKEYRANNDHRRKLQPGVTEPIFDPPDRTCGQIINTVSVEELQTAASSLINSIFGPGDPQGNLALGAISPQIQFGIRARVVCASCQEIEQLLGADGLMNFADYCGPNLFGYNVSHSSLLLEPLDPVTNEPVQGIVYQHLYMKPLNTAQQGAPSESWPDPFNMINEPNGLFIHYDAILPFLVASTGVVVVGPDYFGYGQTYLIPKQILIRRTYQQVATVAYLKSRMIVEELGCTLFRNELSVSGYSEGGYAAVVAARALNDMGLTILDVNAGGAPFRTPQQLSWTIERIEAGNSSGLAGAIIPLVGASYTAANPDLANFNSSQDMIAPEWQNPDNFTQNALMWAAADQSVETLVALLPDNPNDLLNQGFVQRILMNLAEGNLNACDNPVEGVNDLICAAILDNTIIDLVESTPFRISICHSPDDEVISFENNVPNFTSNELLLNVNLVGQMAAGAHLEAAAFCILATVFPLTPFGPPGLTLNGIDPLPEGAVCRTPEPTMMATPAPIMDNVTIPPATIAPMDNVTAAPTSVPTMGNTPMPTMDNVTTTAAPAPTSGATGAIGCSFSLILLASLLWQILA